MDQIKAQLAVVLKHGFWIGSVLILLASTLIWYLSTSSLWEETDSESRKLTSKISRISAISSGMDTVPNEQSHEVMRKMVEDRQAEVLRSWQTLFDRQKPYLTWPVAELGEDFVEKYQGLIPIEQYIEFPPGDKELSNYFLQRYRDHIKGEPKRLAEIAGAAWTASDERSGSLGSRGSLRSLGDSQDDDEAVPVVAWSSESQKKLADDLFRWRNDTPSTLEIYYSQESQWILKQLMTIIKEVNGDATQPYEAKIREIDTINIGQSVRFNVGSITGVAGSSSLGSLNETSMGSSSLGSASSGSGLTNMRSGSLGGGSSEATVDPAEGRYVDKNLQQISASELRSALTSNKPADASLAVAKRVPVMMGLTMDQRTIHELLAACGSADLMVDVTQVRVLGDSGASPGPAARSSGGGGLGGLSSSRSKSVGEPEEYPFDVQVEIYGMIYIYNPPDPEKLPVEEVTKETVEEALGETPETKKPSAVDAAGGTPEDADEQPSNEELPPAAPPNAGAAVPAEIAAPPGGAEAPVDAGTVP